PFGHPMVPTNAALGYFPATQQRGEASSSSISDVCNLIRDLRETPATDAAQQIRSVDGARDLFHPINLREYVPKIGFAAKPGGSVDITLSGSPWRSNGSLFAGSSAGGLWPCGQETQYECASHPDALFCEQACDAEFSARVFPNYRLPNAGL